MRRRKLWLIESGRALRVPTARESGSVPRVSETADQLPTDIKVLQARLATVLADDVHIKLVNLSPAARLDEVMPWAWGSANQIAAPEHVAA
jgi:hypothetical protein